MVQVVQIQPNAPKNLSKYKYFLSRNNILYILLLGLLFILLPSSSNATVVSHTYDNLNRLTSTIYHNGENISIITYTYDAVGNRTSLTSIASIPFDTDTDGDGMPDWWENAHGLNPDSGEGINGPAGDINENGLSNLVEYLNGSNYSAESAYFIDPPTEVINNTDVTINIGGNGVVGYKYRLDGGIWQQEAAIGISIQLTGLSYGTHILFVIGKDSDGYWQSEASAATAIWTISNSPIISLSDINVTDSVPPNDDLHIPFGEVSVTSTPALIWKKHSDLCIRTTPVLGDNGLLYANASSDCDWDNSGIAAFDPTDGSVVWGPVIPPGCTERIYSNFSAFGVSGMAMGANGLIYAVKEWNECGNGNLIALDGNDGSIAWECNQCGPHPRQTPALDESLNSVYFGSSSLCSIDIDSGINNWSGSGGGDIGAGGMAIDSSNNVYYGTHSGSGNTKIRSYSSDGTFRWEKQASSIVAILPGDILLIQASESNALLACDNGGDPLWQLDNFAGAVVDESGNIYSKDLTNAEIISINLEGEERWRTALPNATVTSVYFVDNTGQVYCRGDNLLYAISTNDGSISWSFTADADIRIAVLVPGGHIFLTDADNTFYLLDTSIDYAPSSWSTAYGNHRHTQKAGDILPLPLNEGATEGMPTQTVTISNNGEGDLLIGTLSLTGIDPSDFVILNDNCTEKTLALSETCTADLGFVPSAMGSKTAYLTIPSNDPDESPIHVTLSGEGIDDHAVIYVPEDYSTIQTAIDAADTGDVIIVRQGIYTENVNFQGKAITVKSEDPNDPVIIAATIIDGDQSGSVVTFNSEEGNGSVLSGFTVRNGIRGISCYSSSPKVLNCNIIDNSDSSDFGMGGGIYCSLSSPIITNCTISRNHATGWGGGIYCTESSPAITNCSITGNSVNSYGGGVYCNLSSPIITNCTISANTSGHHGGGVLCSYHSSPVITNCIIIRNSANDGGGVYCYNNSSPTFSNCTISKNSATNYGGGIHYSYYSSPIITNCILWYDLPDELYGYEGAPEATYSDIQMDEDEYTGTGNININPLFVDSNQGDYHLQFGSLCIDKGTNNGAPTEDKDNISRPHDGDGDGTAICDMGAYEFISIATLPDLIIQSLTMTPNNPTTSDDITFTAVIKNIGQNTAGASKAQFAIGTESNPPTYDIPALAPGETYILNRTENLSTAQDYRMTIIADIDNGVDEPDENNNEKYIDFIVSSEHQTIISGIIDSDITWTLAGSPYIITGNTLVAEEVTLIIGPGVVVMFQPGKALVISGLLIARGISGSLITFTSAQPTPAPGSWGYIYFTPSSVDASFDGANCYMGGSVLERCIMEYAGGLEVENNGAVRMDNAHPFINYCTIRNNKASGISGYNLTSTLKITNSIIDNNIATSGGGISGYGGTIIISNNIISNNMSSNSGGGIYIEQSTITISSNIIINNTTSSRYSYHYGGGGIYVYSGTGTISNNIINNNTVSDTNGGGGICSSSHVTISQNVISNNTASYYHGGGIYIAWGASISNNTILRNTALNAPAVSYCCADNWNFNNNTIIGNETTGLTLTYAVSIKGHPFFNYNNMFSNPATYELRNDNGAGSSNLNAKNNWWGTAVESEIETKINHWLDDATKGLVDYTPWDTAIRTDAPISPPKGLTAIAGVNGITLSWIANSEADIAGYKVYWGTKTGYPYTNVIDVRNVTQYTITELPSDTYSVTVTAYDDSYTFAHDATDTIINENQTNGNESWYAVEHTVTVSQEGMEAELCDGIDNDLDGLIDEELTRECSTDCGTGQEDCQDGQWVNCTAPRPHNEVCDGVDNDCDNEIDEECALCGDANQDGVVDIFDALLVSEYDAGLKTQADIPGLPYCDVDNNGEVDIFDALEISKYDAKIIAILGCE